MNKDILKIKCVMMLLSLNEEKKSDVVKLNFIPGFCTEGQEQTSIVPLISILILGLVLAWVVE